MFTFADVLAVLHATGLMLFVGGTATLMIMAVIRRLRLRRPLLVWRTGGLTRAPIAPSLFLLLVGVGLVLAHVYEVTVFPSIAVGYLAGGVFWFVASWLARSTVITEYGLVPDLLRVRHAVVWSQVVDYVSTVRNGRPHFVFLYRGRECQEHHRLDLPVPERYEDEFQKILATKLDASHAFAEGRSIAEMIGDQEEEA